MEKENCDINWALDNAALNDHINMIKFLFDNGARNEKALVTSIYLDRYDIAKFLLENDIAITDYDVMPENALLHGNVDMIKLLIEYGFNIRANDDHIFIKSATYGHYEIVKLLLEYGVNVHANNDEAIKNSAGNGYHYIVRLLIEYGANLYADNEQALKASVARGHYETVKILLENGANIHVAYGHYETVRISLDNGDNIHKEEEEEPLRLAVQYGHFNVVKLLLENGANINGDAIIFAIYSGIPDIVKLFLDNGINMTFYLHDAIMYGHTEIVELFIKYGADIRANNDEAFKLSVKYDHGDIATLLLSHGADIHAGNDEALRYITKNGHDIIKQYMLEKRSEYLYKIRDKKYYHKMIKLLLTYYPDFTMFDCDPIEMMDDDIELKKIFDDKSINYIYHSNHDCQS